MLEFLTMLSRRWRVVLALTILSLLAAGGITREMTPSYRASSQLFVALASADGAVELSASALFSSQRVKSYPDLVDSPLVLQPVIDSLGLDTTPAELASNVRAEVPPNTVLIQVEADDSSATRAAAIANAVATNLAATVEELDRTREDRTSPVRVSVTREAVAPTEPRLPVPWVNLSIGALVGLMLGIAIAALRDTLDTSIKNESDVTSTTGLPTLAQVPTNSDVRAHPVLGAGVNPVWSESYRKLRTNLSFIDPDSPLRVISLVSALSGDGKTLTAVNLAMSLAQSGRAVVLIEADLRRPNMAKLLSLDAASGVTSVVAGKADVASCLQEYEGIQVLTSGPIPPNPSELLGSQAFAAVLASLRQRFDTIVIDTPPLVAVTDAAVVGAASDAVVLVVRANKTKAPDLRRAIFGLRAVDANVVGVVLNQIPLNSATYYQYDYSASPGKGRR